MNKVTLQDGLMRRAWCFVERGTALARDSARVAQSMGVRLSKPGLSVNQDANGDCTVCGDPQCNGMHLMETKDW